MSGKVTAKFKVNSKTVTHPEHNLGNVQLTAVYDPNPESENGKFFQATPSASISLNSIKGAALDAFEQGEEYYVDFIPAKAQQES